MDDAQDELDRLHAENDRLNSHVEDLEKQISLLRQERDEALARSERILDEKRDWLIARENMVALLREVERDEQGFCPFCKELVAFDQHADDCRLKAAIGGE